MAVYTKLYIAYKQVSRHPRATQNANDKHKKKYKKEKSFANAKPFLF